MLAKRIRLVQLPIVVLSLAVVAGGCTPPATRALRNGQRLLERGEAEKAVSEFQLATSLIASNDAAWNYLGVACHRAGQFTNAAAAYQQAIRLNRDLVEARFNLGCLWLDLKRYDQARDAFASCTVLRPDFTAAWVKRGTAELRLRELASAEASFREALKVSPESAEAFNALGLLMLQRNRPRDAAQQFTAAIAAQTNFAPALLNLATVTWQHLNDHAAALRHYRAYLALTPRPADWDAVNRLVQSLAQPAAAPVRASTPVAATSAPPMLAQSPPPRVAEVTSRPPVTVRTSSPPVTAKPAPAPPAPVVSAEPKPAEVVKLSPEPALKMATDAPASAKSSTTSGTVSTSLRSGVESPASSSAPSEEKTGKPGFLSRINPANLFRDDDKPATRVTPLPSGTPASAADNNEGRLMNTTAPVSTRATFEEPSGAANIPRYRYLAPVVPASGDRATADKAITQGQRNQSANRLKEAIRDYQQAVRADPGYYRARFALGLAALQASEFATALNAWEYALAIEPGSGDARYNFALALKGANYPVDAARELQRVVAANPGEVRAHLALGNLYAETFREAAKARAHYQKVLELSPSHPQSTAIRYWLLANGG